MTMKFTSQASIAYGLDVGRLQFSGMCPNLHPGGASDAADEVSASEGEEDGSRLDFRLLPKTISRTDSASLSEHDTGCMPGVLLRFGEGRRDAALLLAEPLPC